MDKLRSFVNSIYPVSEDSMQALERILHPIVVEKGEFYSVSGVPASKMGFLQSGVLRGFHKSTDGQEYNRVFFLPPMWVGALSSLVTGQNNRIDIQALERCEILEGDYSDFLALYDSHPQIERVARLIAEYIHVAAERREIELVQLTAKQRYLNFQKEKPYLANRLPLFHIASFLGVTATQLSRIRASLSRSE